MEQIIIATQLTVAFILLNVWIFKYQQMIEEFKHYRLPEWLRVFTCLAKISIALLLIIGVWYQTLTLIAAQTLMVIMIFAVLAHIRVKNPIIKMAPAFSVFIMCFFITYGLKAA